MELFEKCYQPGRVDEIRENHASLYDGCKLSYGKMLRYFHNDMEDLEKKLQKVPKNAGCLIVTDGVFSMGGDIANLPEICRLAKKYGAIIPGRLSSRHPSRLPTVRRRWLTQNTSLM